MISIKDIEDSPGGIAYVVSGKCKEHIEELVRYISLILSKPASSMPKEDSDNYIYNKLAEQDKQIEELYTGLNTLNSNIEEVRHMIGIYREAAKNRNQQSGS